MRNKIKSIKEKFVTYDNGQSLDDMKNIIINSNTDTEVIDLKSDIVDLLECIESELQMKMTKYENDGLEPKLTRTDIMLYFSKLTDKIKKASN